MRASLLFVPASQTPGFHPHTRENRACWGPRICWEQLRAGLRRKEGSVSRRFTWPDSAALDSLRSSRAKRSSQALIPVLWAETWKGHCVESTRERKDGRHPALFELPLQLAFAKMLPHENHACREPSYVSRG